MLEKQISIDNENKTPSYGSINNHGICIYDNVHKNLSTTAIQSIGESKVFHVVFNMTNGITGVALVGVPYVFHCGLFTSVIMFIVFPFITLYSLEILVVAAQLCNVQNYEDLCQYCFGIYGYTIISISLLLADFGCCVLNLIILKDAISQITAIWHHNTGDDIFIFLFISWFIIFPSCIPSDISKIETISKFSIVASILIIGILITKWIQISDDQKDFYIASHINLFINLEAVPQSLGITAFIFLCQDCSFLICNTLKNPTISRWRMVTSSACLIAVTMYGMCGIFGYLLFGNELQSNILNNFGTDNVLVIIGLFVYGLTAAITFPIPFFVVRHVCYTTVYRKSNHKINDASFKKTILFTVPLFALCLSLGMYLDDLGIVMSLSGSIPAVVISFIMPALCYLKAIKRCDNWILNKTSFASIVLLLFGVLVGVFSTVITLIQQA